MGKDCFHELQKKLSIPATVSRVLKYIPELQKQVERLEKRKAEMLSKLGCTKHDNVEQIHYAKRRRDEPRVVLSSPSIVASQVGDKEVVIQICATDVRNSPLSLVLQKLEDEGLQILNASTFTTAGERVFCTLQLKVIFSRLLCFDPQNAVGREEGIKMTTSLTLTLPSIVTVVVIVIATCSNSLLQSFQYSIQSDY